MENVGFSVQVDTSQLNEALEIAKQLEAVLQEVNHLIIQIGTGRTVNGTDYKPFHDLP